jgi:hypothetical protein
MTLEYGEHLDRSNEPVRPVGEPASGADTLTMMPRPV